MAFSEKDKLKALAIVHIFETSKPFGDYAACVVLNDGAGVSYGINQFTHRSGSLEAVVREYLRSGCDVGRRVFESRLAALSSRSAAAIRQLSHDGVFKAALKKAASTPEMRAAQHKIAFEKYLKPALDECARLGFALPLSLAIIYDSINHGSYEKIRDKVSASRSQFMADAHFEKAWITEYVQDRDRWLESIPRLKSTDYRTDFFLAQIARGNWNLDLPLNVHGVRLTDAMLAGKSVGVPNPAVEQPAVIQPEPSEDLNPTVSAEVSTDDAQPAGLSVGSMLETASAIFEKVGKPIDTAIDIGNTFQRRRDGVKSLWTTIIGSIYQALWAVFAFLVGLPWEVWLVVALAAAAFGLFYLYRQISLGRIREQANLKNEH